jgi:vacuolar-type H+-ATPase subunit I/STV1
MSAKGKDESVFRMLQSERDRCALVIEKINRELGRLPKGSLGQRMVKSHGKEYIYPCLKYRNESGVKLEHLSAKKAEELKPLLEKRKKLKEDLKVNKKRISTLNAILQKGQS